jgi:hypothetical protein
MLLIAFIFLAIAVSSAYYQYVGGNSTFLLIAKVFMYFSIAVFFILTISHIFSTIPPIPDDTSHRIL